MVRVPFRALLAATLVLGGTAASAMALPSDDQERRCWLEHTRDRTRVNLTETTTVDFSNLRNGQAVSSPMLVEFAVRGMGVVPAGKELKGTGHHHILVDQAMPPSVTDKLPFNDRHKHFGKGQTATMLDLPPGPHTLRLLFADHDHRPYFVFSREITVQVLGPRSAVARPKIDATNFEPTCKAWYQDEVSRPRPPDEPLHFSNVRAGELLTSPFNLRLGVDGYGVCASGPAVEKTGHFVVDVLGRDRKPVQTFDLSNGATQVNVFVALGNYTLRLRFVDPKSGADLLPAHEMPVSVTAQDRV